jgi:hypothetical protein
MRINDDSLGNVAFIGIEKSPIEDGMGAAEMNDAVHWGGTGFFVTVR